MDQVNLNPSSFLKKNFELWYLDLCILSTPARYSSCCQNKMKWETIHLSNLSTIYLFNFYYLPIQIIFLSIFYYLPIQLIYYLPSNFYYLPIQLIYLSIFYYLPIQIIYYLIDKKRIQQ